MQITTHLGFNGNCREAFEMYERVLGGKIVFSMTFGESPMATQFPAELHSRIIHIALQTDGGLIQGADSPHGEAVNPAGFCVCVATKDAAEAARVFKGLSDGGKVQMEMQKTFWSPAFGMCTDKFGTPWMVNTDGPMPAQG